MPKPGQGAVGFGTTAAHENLWRMSAARGENQSLFAAWPGVPPYQVACVVPKSIEPALEPPPCGTTRP